MYCLKYSFVFAATVLIATVPGWAQSANGKPEPSAAGNSATVKPMGNADVIAYAAAGLSDDLIIAKIQAAPSTNFDASLDAIRSLKAAHVTDAVIRVMIDPHAAAISSTPPPSGLPKEDGVYYRKQGVYTEIEPEVAKFRTGMLKMMATAGMLKTNVKARVDGPHSAALVVSPPEFVLVLPDDQELAGFQLVRMVVKSNYREFNTSTGGLLQSANGESAAAIRFDGSKIGPRTYALTLPAPLQPGEYAFVPPRGTLESNSVESTGRIYAFHIAD